MWWKDWSENVLVKNAMIRDLSVIFKDEKVESFVIQCLRHKKTGLPVVDEDFKVVGYISEENIIKSSLPSYFSLLQSASFIPDTHQFVKKLEKIKDYPVSEFMTKPPITVGAEDTLIYAADLFIKNSIKVLPVVNDQNILIGVLSRLYLIHAASHGKVSEE